MNNPLRSLVVVSLALTAFACSTSTDVEEGPEAQNVEVGTSTDELMTTADGNSVLAPPELADPGSGCFVTNLTCTLSPNGVRAASTREGWILDARACSNRAKELSTWCGNGPGQVTTSTFKYRGRAISGATYAQPNSTRCIVNLPVCRKNPAAVGRFGDDGNGADSSAPVCAKRAGEFFTYCANLPHERVVTTFESNGQPVASTIFPK